MNLLRIVSMWLGLSGLPVLSVCVAVEVTVNRTPSLADASGGGQGPLSGVFMHGHGVATGSRAQAWCSR